MGAIKKMLKMGVSVSSPMVLLQVLFSALVIGGYIGIEIATFDIPRAYLHSDMPKYKNISLN